VVATAASDRTRPLRAVVNLAGGYAGGAKVEATPIEDFEAQLRLNLRPTYLVVRAALEHLIEASPATIVCVSSRAALHPFSGAAGYIAAKSAVLAFARAVAVEHGGDGVRTNTVIPSVIDTEANRAAQPDADRSRWVAPERIAQVIRFLCSPASDPINGAAIPVYGTAA
jgi:NAD(P)-dependent dehydrogenase (short-subunit alcohol dehydrogenase family)